MRSVFAGVVACLTVTLPFLNLSAFGSSSAHVTLAWDPSAGFDVVGYRLYHGGKSAVYTNIVDLSYTTTATVSNLVQGATYYFAVTAYDATGLESAFSSEVSYTVPISTNAPTLGSVSIVPGSGAPAVISGTGNVGDIYTVLSTQDFVSWQTLGTVTVGQGGTFQFSDPGAALVPATFYRLRRLQVGP